ncbi:hypothetical protein D3C80_1738910 [compost metagenome]
MDGDPVTIDVDHDAGDDCTRLHVEGFQTFFKEFCEAFAHVYTRSQGHAMRPVPRHQQTRSSHEKKLAGSRLVPYRPRLRLLEGRRSTFGLRRGFASNRQNPPNTRSGMLATSEGAVKLAFVKRHPVRAEPCQPGWRRQPHRWSFASSR